MQARPYSQYADDTLWALMIIIGVALVSTPGRALP
jgi:hypothetical protein